MGHGSNLDPGQHLNVADPQHFLYLLAESGGFSLRLKEIYSFTIEKKSEQGTKTNWKRNKLLGVRIRTLSFYLPVYFGG